MDCAVKSQRPIFDAIIEPRYRHKDIHIMYGDDDWMDSGNTAKVIKNENMNITVDFITNCDH